MGKLLLSPKVDEPGIPGFLIWARRDDPALYAALVRQFPEVAAFDNYASPAGLSGFASLFSSLASSLASKASAIGSFVVKNALPIATAAAPVLVAKKQADVAKAQIKLAQVQGTPMQTAMTQQDGYYYPVPVQKTLGSYTVAGIPTWVLIAGGFALSALLILRRK